MKDTLQCYKSKHANFLNNLYIKIVYGILNNTIIIVNIKTYAKEVILVYVLTRLTKNSLYNINEIFDVKKNSD